MGHALALDAAWLFAALLLLLVLLAIGIAARRFLLERGGGTVDCSLRRADGPWRPGVAAYQGDQLCWYHQFSILLRPQVILERRTLTVASRRMATPAESSALGPGHFVVECKIGPGRSVELAMSEAALTGFLSWLEAAPPGSYLDQIA
ncbi:MAG TPA: DUF2550 domain-containing protein [Streptosporangiaceae bacterium]|nr:DUF2550 domain-containing protein [Streptosporangiaceae bacterium]